MECDMKNIGKDYTICIVIFNNGVISCYMKLNKSFYLMKAFEVFVYLGERITIHS